MRLPKLTLNFDQPTLRITQLPLTLSQLRRLGLRITHRSLQLRLRVSQPIRELRKHKGQLLQLPRQNTQSRLRPISLLRNTRNLPPQPTDPTLNPPRLLPYPTDRSLRFQSLTSQRRRRRLQLLHHPQLTSQHGRDLLQLLIRILQLRLRNSELLLRPRHIRPITIHQLAKLRRSLLIENNPTLMVGNSRL